MDFRIYKVGSPAGSFTEFSLPFNQDLGGGDQRWSSETQTFNLLSGISDGLSNGTYELGVFLRETSSDGGAFSSNGGNNYGATFVVVPEFSTFATFGIPAVLGALAFRRRQTKA